MDANEFCRWLSGHFELSEEDKGWSPTQAAKVAFNLDKALAAAPPSEAAATRADGFANWLQGFMEIHMEKEGGAIPAAALAKIEKSLGAVHAAAKPAPKPAAGRDDKPRFETMC